MVNHITYTMTDKPIFGSMYQITFNSEYPVKSDIIIGMSNGNKVPLHADKNNNISYLYKDVSVLGISFSGEPFMEEIEDDFFIYKIVIL